MLRTVLAIDGNMDTYRHHVPVWAKHGVDVQYAPTVSDAISRLANGHEFLLIAMNEEADADFFTHLRLVHDVTATQIHVFSRFYSAEKKSLLMQYGAFSYDQHGTQAETNVKNSLGVLQFQYALSQRQIKKLPVLIGGDIILLLEERNVLVGDKQVALTRKEIDILRFFLLNINVILSSEQIYREVWSRCCDDAGSRKVVWNHIYSLRQKIEGVSGQEYIHTEKGFGYRFLPPCAL